MGLCTQLYTASVDNCLAKFHSRRRAAKSTCGERLTGQIQQMSCLAQSSSRETSHAPALHQVRPMKQSPAATDRKTPDANAELAAAVARARLRVDVAKQSVRLAKEELKRARKRIKDAKREVRRARKRAGVARKAWKQARRTKPIAAAGRQGHACHRRPRRNPAARSPPPAKASRPSHKVAAADAGCAGGLPRSAPSPVAQKRARAQGRPSAPRRRSRTPRAGSHGATPKARRSRRTATPPPDCTANPDRGRLWYPTPSSPCRPPSSG